MLLFSLVQCGGISLLRALLAIQTVTAIHERRRLAAVYHVNKARQGRAPLHDQVQHFLTRKAIKSIGSVNRNQDQVRVIPALVHEIMHRVKHCFAPGRARTPEHTCSGSKYGTFRGMSSAIAIFVTSRRRTPSIATGRIFLLPLSIGTRRAADSKGTTAAGTSALITSVHTSVRSSSPDWPSRGVFSACATR